ncbi:hypothetical protein COLO4_01851, partial [Corchorus olitorius]
SGKSSATLGTTSVAPCSRHCSRPCRRRCWSACCPRPRMQTRHWCCACASAARTAKHRTWPRCSQRWVARSACCRAGSNRSRTGRWGSWWCR